MCRTGQGTRRLRMGRALLKSAKRRCCLVYLPPPELGLYFPIAHLTHAPEGPNVPCAAERERERRKREEEERGREEKNDTEEKERERASQRESEWEREFCVWEVCDPSCVSYYLYVHMLNTLYMSIYARTHTHRRTTTIIFGRAPLWRKCLSLTNDASRRRCGRRVGTVFPFTAQQTHGSFFLFSSILSSFTVHACMRVCMCMCVCVRVRVCACVGVSASVNVIVSVSASVWVCLCVCECVWVRMYLHTCFKRTFARFRSILASSTRDTTGLQGRGGGPDQVRERERKNA